MSKQIQFDDSMIGEIEEDIRPPLKNAITLPLFAPTRQVRLREESLAVYVAQSVFDPADHAERCKEVARLIVAAPDLLKALKLYVDHFGDPLGVARPAIARAEGQISNAPVARRARNAQSSKDNS